MDYGSRGVDGLRFQVLGPLWVGGDDGEVVVSGARRQAVLVRLLVAANEVVPATHLIDDVWQTAAPAGAPATLQTYISALRKLLGRDRVQFRDSGYVLVVNTGELDAAVFEAELAAARRARAIGQRSRPRGCWARRWDAGTGTRWSRWPGRPGQQARRPAWSSYGPRPWRNG